jgi:hypothetical protein
MCVCHIIEDGSCVVMNRAAVTIHHVARSSQERRLQTSHRRHDKAFAFASMASSQEIKHEDLSGNSEDVVHHLLIDQMDSNMTEIDPQVVKSEAEDAAAVLSGRALTEASAATIYPAEKNIQEEKPLHSNFPVKPEQGLTSSSCLTVQPPSGMGHVKTNAVADVSVPLKSEAASGENMIVDEEEGDRDEAGEEDDASELSEGEDLRVSPQNSIAKPST